MRALMLLLSIGVSLVLVLVTGSSISGNALQSGDHVFLQARAGSGNHVDVDGDAVQARWKERGLWQALAIEKTQGGIIYSGDEVSFRAHTGNQIDAQSIAVQARWREFGAWQTFVVEKTGGGPIQPGDNVCLRTHTGHYIDEESNLIRARWAECGAWQTFRIENDDLMAVRSGSKIFFKAHTGRHMHVQGDHVGADWYDQGMWQTFVIQNSGGRAVFSGDVIHAQAHTGNFLDVEGDVVRARWSERGTWQSIVIEKNGGGAIYPNDTVFLRAHTGHHFEVEGSQVRARWHDRGAWQQFVIEETSVTTTQASPTHSSFLPPTTTTTSQGLQSTPAPSTTTSQGVQFTTVEDCLRASIDIVSVPGEPDFDQHKRLVNHRKSIAPTPVAVARVTGPADVQAAVRCAAAFGLRACAKGGGHGFNNAAGCSSGVQVDMQDLQDFSVNRSARITTFGSGHTLGQIYYKLAQDPYRLLIPGGTVSGVGASGLILGCGKGKNTLQHSLACDSLLGIEFVDAHGALRTAYAGDVGNHADADMLWMARGGGGEFPGLVTKFTMQAYPIPEDVHEEECDFKSQARTVVRGITAAWLAQGAKMVDPQRKIFASMQLWAPPQPAMVRITIACVGCDASQKSFVSSTVGMIKESSGLSSESIQCKVNTRSWIGQVLYDSGVEHAGVMTPPNEMGLLNRNSGWAKGDGPVSAQVTGRVGYEWSISEELFDQIYHWTYVKPPVQQGWVLLVLWEFIGGPKVSEVAPKATAYGHRTAKWIMEMRYQWPAPKSDTFVQDVMTHSVDFQRGVDPHLPCGHFYNYIDDNMTCARTDDEWFGAYFSDVPRVKAIKASADPHGVFPSRTQRPWA